MRRATARPCIIGVGALALVFAFATFALAGSVGEGMLRTQDVGLDQVEPPHEATLIRASQVAPGTCTEPESREYQGRLVAFGVEDSSLNEYVLDFASSAEAGTAFDSFLADDQASVECGQSSAALKKVPKGVGSRRYTVVEKVKVNGGKVTTVSICTTKGKRLVLLVFIGWPASESAPAAVAKKAVKLLS